MTPFAGHVGKGGLKEVSARSFQARKRGKRPALAAFCFFAQAKRDMKRKKRGRLSREEEKKGERKTLMTLIALMGSQHSNRKRREKLKEERWRKKGGPDRTQKWGKKGKRNHAILAYKPMPAA